MRGALPAIAVGAALALVALLAVLWLSPVSRTDAARADALASELRCPDCQGLSVADSQTGSAREIRRQVEADEAGPGTSATEPAVRSPGSGPASSPAADASAAGAGAGTDDGTSADAAPASGVGRAGTGRWGAPLPRSGG